MSDIEQWMIGASRQIANEMESITHVADGELRLDIDRAAAIIARHAPAPTENEAKTWEKVDQMRQYLMFELDSFDLDSNGHRGWVASFDDGARTWCGHGRSRIDAIEKAIEETEKGLAALAARKNGDATEGS